MLDLRVDDLKTLDLVVIERILEEIEADKVSQARQNYVAAMADFKADAPDLPRDRHVKYKGVDYKHASLDSISDLIGKALAKQGLVHRWTISQDDKDISVHCVLEHVDGHSEFVTMTAPADVSGMKNPIQAIGSTLTYLQRYTLLAITGMAAKGSDDDAQSSATIERLSEEQVVALRQLIDWTETDEARFLKWVQAKSLEDIQASQYPHCVKALEAKQK